MRKAAGRLRGRILAVRYAQSELPAARLGMMVPKRLAPRAVDRNRIKRRLRATFRAHSSRIGSVDLVASLRTRCASLDQARAAAAEFGLLLEKLAARKVRP